jgi:uncharacterized OB-fold protein
MSAMNRPGPDITPESKPYWDSIAAHAMKLQRCTRCETFRFYPTPVCPHCFSTDFTWERVSDEGRLYSFSVVHKPVTEDFEPETPYVVALVTLAEGPTLMTNLLDVPEGEIQIGMAVRIAYRDFEGFSLPVAVRGD